NSGGPMEKNPALNRMRLHELAYLHSHVLDLQQQYRYCEATPAHYHIGDLRYKLQRAVINYNLIADETHETAFEHSSLPHHISLKGSYVGNSSCYYTSTKSSTRTKDFE